MSLPLTVTFALVDWIAAGLADGSLQRIGGVILESVTRQVVCWLQETDVNQRLDGIEQGLQLTSAASMLSLGVGVMGFTVISKRLNDLEQRLKQSEELLKKIDRKIDLGFYANFRAALDLAVNAFTMTKGETRRSMAIQAINRFLEAEHIYTDYTDKELEQKSQIADEYLLTLSLAYLAEARCYLELEEHDTALRRFQEGEEVVRSRIHKYVNLLLTSNPAAYLQPWFKGNIDLRRLTRIYQWSDPSLDESAVFEMQRQNFVNFVKDPNKWVESLPAAILTRGEVQGSWLGLGPSNEDVIREAEKRLPKVMEVMESMIETHRRFKAYQLEIQAISKLGITFHDWLNLAPSEAKPNAQLMYIICEKPLELKPAF